MPAERFYLPTHLTPGLIVDLKGQEHHHLFRVMRLRAGEKVELIDGKGALAIGQVLSTESQGTTLKILSATQTPRSRVTSIAAIPLMRGAKLEWAIEKGTELGADSFWIYIADASKTEALSPHQLERLRLVILSAAKQSRRLFLPSIEILPHLAAVFHHSGQFLFGDPKAENFNWPALASTVICITGPESGFSDEELNLLEKQATPIRLGPYVLRAETAPIAALSIVQSRLGQDSNL